MKGKFVFVVNPRSANGATLRMFERMRGRFASALGEIEVCLTTAPHHATVLARDAVRAGAKAVVSVGGDGTNNEVIHGFFEEDGTAIGTQTALGVVTSGTGGDFRRSFGWQLDPLADLQRLQRFSTKRIDLGRVSCRDPQGKMKHHLFLNISSLGVSGEVADRVNNSSKALGAKISFLLGTVQTMLGYQPKRVRIRFDQGAWQERLITLVAVANGQFFGGGMQIAPGAHVDDGFFDVVVVEGGGLGFFARHGMKLYSGKHIGMPEVHVQRCQSVEVEPLEGQNVVVDLDGESPGTAPAEYQIIPGAISLLV